MGPNFPITFLLRSNPQSLFFNVAMNHQPTKTTNPQFSINILFSFFNQFCSQFDWYCVYITMSTMCLMKCLNDKLPSFNLCQTVQNHLHHTHNYTHIHNLTKFMIRVSNFIPTCCSFWPIIDLKYEYNNIKYTSCFHSRT